MKKKSGNRHLKDADGVVHAPGPDGNDLVLCGDAREGESGEQNMIWTAARINCERCVRVIEHAQTFGPRDYAVLPPLRKEK